MKKGFTLIELMIAVAIFSLVVVSASGIFATSLKFQRKSIANQQLLDQTSYLLEYISRAVRTAKKDDLSGTCTGTAKLNYAFSGQCLKFRDYNDQCRQFCLVGTSIKDQGGNYLTSPSSDLRVLLFNANLAGQTQDDNDQPRVTLLFDIQGRENARIKIQTTISQRSLDVKR